LSEKKLATLITPKGC